MLSSIYGTFPGVVSNDALFRFRFIYKVLRGFVHLDMFSDQRIYI